MKAIILFRLLVLCGVIFSAVPSGFGASSPGPLVNFRSMLQWETIAESPDGLGLGGNSAPPDTTGAVGDHHIMTVANYTIRISDKLGGSVRTYGLKAWWNDLRKKAGVKTPDVRPFDPVVVFDPYAHRWILGSSCFQDTTTPSRYALAVSQTSDPLGQWWYYEFSAADAAWRYTPGSWFDQSTIGFNAYFIGISVTTLLNLALKDRTFHDSVIILDRGQAYSGKARYWELTGFPPRPGTSDTSYPWAFRTCVCRTYDLSENKLYLIRTQDSGSPDLVSGSSSAIYALSSIEPGSTPGTLLVNVNYVFPKATGWGDTMSPGPYDNGNYIPEKGASDRINVGDARINTAVYRNGSIWAAHTAFLGDWIYDTDHTEVQWLEVRPTGAIRQVGRIGAEGIWLSYPAIGVNASGDAIVGYSSSSSSTYFSSGYAYHTASDPLGTMRTGTIYRPGTGTLVQTDEYGRNRAGDYSAAAVDPEDDLTLWVAQEFGETGNRWGIQWAATQPPGAGAPAFSSPLTMHGVVAEPFTNFLHTIPLATNFAIIGSLPPGLSLDDPLSGRIVGIPIAYGDFTVAVTAKNAAGSSTAALTITIDSSDLADAIDTWRIVTTSTPYSWFRETDDTHDGSDAARSGPTPDNRSSWMDVRLIGPAEVTFWWKVSSEGSDYLSCYIDSVLQTRISGKVDWTFVTLSVPGTGDHTLRWEYRKDSSDALFEDAGWVDELNIRDHTVIIPRYLYKLPFVINRPVYALPLPDPDPGVYRLLGELPSGLSFDPNTGAFSGSVQTPGTYTFNVQKTTPFGSQIVPVSLTISGILFDAALNDPGAAYTSGGDAEWATSDEPTTSHDQSAAARSGALIPGQQSWLQRSVDGPALLSFWWATSGNINDLFTVQVDGQSRATLSGNTDWSQKLLDIPAGAHTVRWLFQKGPSSNIGEPEESEAVDANPPPDFGDGVAWLDEVAVLQAAPPVLPQFTEFRFVAGQPISRRIEASNDPSSYSISGQLPPGLVFDLTSGLLSGLPQSAGAFQLFLTASNSAGTGSGMLFIIVDDRGLGAAIGLQDAIPDTSPNSPWTLDNQTLWNGGPSARSGSIGDGASSWIELPMDGPADVSFWWRVSSETTYDFLRLLVDGSEQDSISGETDWTLKHLILAPGSHTLRWQYDKDQAGNTGQDAGWVAGLSSQTLFPPDFVGARIWHGQPGQPFSVSIQAGGADVILADPLPQPFTYNPQTRLLSGTPPSEGTFSFSFHASNMAGTSTRTAALFVNSLPIEQAVDYPGAWQNDPANPWFVQSELTHDGISAAQSGPLGDNGSSSLTHTFDGPGTLNCWMAVSSEREADFFRLLLDGDVRAEIAGARTWRQVSLFIPSGTHELEWRYEKDASGSDGQDSAWLDQVTFIPAPPIPELTLQPAVTGIVASAFALAPSVSGTVNSWTADGLPLGIGINRSTGALYGTPVVSGQFLVTLNASNVRGTASAQTTITVLTPFQSWAAAQGLSSALAAPNADPDGDGIINIVEYALGLRPSTPDAVPFDVHNDLDNGRLQLSFVRDTSAVGCTVQVEASTDLSVWELLAKGGDGFDVAPRVADVSVAEQSLNGSLRRVTVTVPQQARPVLFLRLSVGYSP